MPETTFTMSLPDGSIRPCYSPSTVVHKYFEEGQTIGVAEFVEQARLALAEASDRVQAKYGFSCSSAMASFQDIERWAATCGPDDVLTVSHIHPSR